MMKKIFFVLVLSGVFLFNAGGQTFKVKGIVTDSLGDPLEGVLALTRSNPKKVVKTNEFGRFVLKANVGDTLFLVSQDRQIFPVYLAAEPKKNIKFILKASGRTVEWNKNTVKAISEGEKENIRDILTLLQTSEYWKHFNDIFDMIKDRYPDLEVDKRSGTIYIRGISSLNNIPALIVVDGVKDYPLSSINPETVRSIKVVRDGTSGMYGGRAMGGVVVITTKKGME